MCRVSAVHVMMRLVVALQVTLFVVECVISFEFCHRRILLAFETLNSSSSSNFHSRLLAFFLRLPSYFGYLVAPSLPWSMLLMPIGDLSLAIFTSLLSSILFIRPFHSILRWCIHLSASSTLRDLLMASLLTLSNIFPEIRLSILISVVSNMRFVFDVSDLYRACHDASNSCFAGTWTLFGYCICQFPQIESSRHSVLLVSERWKSSFPFSNFLVPWPALFSIAIPSPSSLMRALFLTCPVSSLPCM